MDKKIIAFAIVLSSLGLTIVPQTHSIPLSLETKDEDPLLTTEDEGDHFPCGYEVWCYQAVILLDNGELWDAAATFVYFMNKTRKGFSDGISFLRIRHWNRQTCKVYDSFRIDTFPGIFQTSKNGVNLMYGNSSAQGMYPYYHFHCEDNVNDIITDLQFHATSLPCWTLEGPTNCVIPWGFSGTGKAYFVPSLEVNGTITMNGTTYKATGIAYYEHDFIYCDFARPFAIYTLQEFRTGRKLFSSAIKWYLRQVFENRPMPRPAPLLHISNDNLFGW